MTWKEVVENVMAGHPPEVEVVVGMLSKMTGVKRLEVFSHFCEHCGIYTGPDFGCVKCSGATPLESAAIAMAALMLSKLSEEHQAEAFRRASNPTCLS